MIAITCLTSSNKRKKYYIQQAIKEALKSSQRCKHGCVVVHKNKVISRGYNKAMGSKKGLKTYHAEFIALKNLNKQNTRSFTRMSMYVVRVFKQRNNHDYSLCLSRPCLKCTKMLNRKKNRTKIKQVFYSCL